MSVNYKAQYSCFRCPVELKAVNMSLIDEADLLFLQRARRGSRINTDRFPKRAPKARAFSGVRGLAPPRNYLDFYSLKSPFLGFRVIQMG